jgi:hypothetical protein
VKAKGGAVDVDVGVGGGVGVEGIEVVGFDRAGWGVVVGQSFSPDWEDGMGASLVGRAEVGIAPVGP